MFSAVQCSAVHCISAQYATVNFNLVQGSVHTYYNIYEYMIFLNNVTYFIHCILALYIYMISAVQCSAVHCIAA